MNTLLVNTVSNLGTPPCSLGAFSSYQKIRDPYKRPLLQTQGYLYTKKIHWSFTELLNQLVGLIVNFLQWTVSKSKFDILPQWKAISQYWQHSLLHLGLFGISWQLLVASIEQRITVCSSRIYNKRACLPATLFCPRWVELWLRLWSVATCSNWSCMGSSLISFYKLNRFNERLILSKCQRVTNPF